MEFLDDSCSLLVNEFDWSIIAELDWGEFYIRRIGIRAFALLCLEEIMHSSCPQPVLHSTMNNPVVPGFIRTIDGVLTSLRWIKYMSNVVFINHCVYLSCPCACRV